MPSSQTTYLKTVGDWELLLAAIAEHAPTMTGVEDLRSGLEQLLAQARAIKARQDTAAANRQRNTQELKEVLVQGRDFAMRIRGLAKAGLGPKNEGISRFAVAPLRRRGRVKPAEPAPPVVSPPQKGGDSPATP